MEQGFDLTAIARNMLTTVPLWLFAWAIFKSWMHRSKENKEMIEKQFKNLKEESEANRKLIQENVSAIHDKLNQMMIKLAGQGVDNLKTDLEVIKKETVKNEMKLDAAFKILDRLEKLPRRASDK